MIFTKANAQTVARLVSEKVGADVMQSTRRQPIMEGRQVAMYILYQQGAKCQQVARFFGRTHATVIYSYYVVQEQLEISRTFREKWKSLIDLCVSFTHENIC